MNTVYNILWVDDDLGSIDTDIEDVREFFEGVGIEANIQTVEAQQDGSVHDQISQKLANPELDLIMVDFKMPGMSGSELITIIRNTDHIYLPVIFYSSVSTEEIFRGVIEEELDGVYITSRDQLSVKFDDVVGSLLKKEQTIKGHEDY